ncbi:Dot/Icm T4SS effector VpdC [Legionella gresilensis]|uniref:Dot/Icm T4SS effector VpdC n=1 Tax=Legionella gresilensis TaxID=91823 RepID=UPI001041B7C8|nr:Dot/Icm T4SS effector VpdC [Legionella gresilensis]
MKKGKVLSELLSQNGQGSPNSILLKKYLLCVYYGWFRINGLSPDKQFSLSDYLFDDERLIFDFTHLSKPSREEFLNWFLSAHLPNAQRTFLVGAKTNDYRGYTAEVGLNWWGRVTNLLFYRKKAYKWHLGSSKLGQAHQLNSIEITEGENGLLIGFNLNATKETDNKYHLDNDNQDKPLRNTKRVFLNDALVKQLINTDLKAHDYINITLNPHPFSTHVHSSVQRIQAMLEYRKVQSLITTLPWLIRFWRWLKSHFINNPPVEKKATQPQQERKNFTKHQLLTKKDTVQVYRRPDTGEILIIEKRPDLDTGVYCGGGVRFFGHIGAYKAFEDAKIKYKKFAGSSAGAIMATLCYLGFSSKEIFEFFKNFRQEHFVFYDIDRYGISDKRALKAALDFMILKKVNEIIKQYNLDQTNEGKEFLTTQVFKNGKITFESLKNLKKAYPDCSLGEELIVTATNIEKRETRYFSASLTPTVEISEACAISASFPVIFKPTIFEGEKYNDGGILNNLPMEVFYDDYSTFLESPYNNSLSLIAFQFDSGQERGIVDNFFTQVYRENFILNWIYGLLTGVKDPVSAWERERIKLRNYGNQIVLISSADIGSTQFNLDAQGQVKLFKSGYEAAKNYINTRYRQDDLNAPAVNEEYLFSTFTSVFEAMYYACYRGHKDWFEYFANLCLLEGAKESDINQLRNRYFVKQDNNQDKNEEDIIAEKIDTSMEIKDLSINRILFTAIYPIFLKLPCNFINNAFDLKLFKWARHSFSSLEPLECLTYLQKLQGETHLLINIFIHLLSDFKAAIIDIETLCRRLGIFESLLGTEDKLYDPSFYGTWHSMSSQLQHIVKDFEKIEWSTLVSFCNSLKTPEKSNPLPTIVAANEPLNDAATNSPSSIDEQSSSMVRQLIH